MKYLKRQEGMAVPLVVGLVALVLIVVGVAVWQSQKAKSKVDQTAVSPSPSTTAQASASPAATATPAPMLVIKELGVEVPLANGPADLSYSYAYNKDLSAATAQLGTAKCSNGSLGELVKITGTIPASVKPYNAGTDLPYLLKQYSGQGYPFNRSSHNIWWWTESPTSACCIPITSTPLTWIPLTAVTTSSTFRRRMAAPTPQLCGKLFKRSTVWSYFRSQAFDSATAL